MPLYLYIPSNRPPVLIATFTLNKGGQIIDYVASEPCKRPSKRVMLVLSVKMTQLYPSPVQLQITEATLPQERVDHESMCSGVQRESLIL